MGEISPDGSIVVHSKERSESLPVFKNEKSFKVGS